MDKGARGSPSFWIVSGPASSVETSQDPLLVRRFSAMVKRTVGMGRRLPSFRFADPARLLLFLLHSTRHRTGARMAALVEAVRNAGARCVNWSGLDSRCRRSRTVLRSPPWTTRSTASCMRCSAGSFHRMDGSRKSPRRSGSTHQHARLDCGPHRRHKGLGESDAGVLHFRRIGRARCTGCRRDPQSLDRRTLHRGARRRTVLERDTRHPLARS